MADQLCTIGKSITIRGNLTGAEDLAVEGRIEGSVALQNHLLVEPTGEVVADIDVEELTVSGVVQGEIRASRQVTISAGAKVMGNIRTPRVHLAEGARFKGRIEMDVQLPEGVTPR